MLSSPCLWNIYSIPRLAFFSNNMSVRVLHAFIGFSAIDTEDNETCKPLQGSFLILMHLEPWSETVVKLLAENKSQFGYLQKLCADIYGRLLLLIMGKLPVYMWAFLEYVAGLKSPLLPFPIHYRNFSQENHQNASNGVNEFVRSYFVRI